MVKGNQTQAASVAEESAKGIQKSSTRGAGERTTPQRCEPLGGMVDANVKLVMSVFAHTQAAFDVYIAGLKDRLEVWAKMFSLEGVMHWHSSQHKKRGESYKGNTTLLF